MAAPVDSGKGELSGYFGLVESLLPGAHTLAFTQTTVQGSYVRVQLHVILLFEYCRDAGRGRYKVEWGAHTPTHTHTPEPAAASVEGPQADPASTQLARPRHHATTNVKAPWGNLGTSRRPDSLTPHATRCRCRRHHRQAFSHHWEILLLQ
ncbi:hypothetical protein E2C01_076086 [Portunus trituberculatus]|uniref:Uncharacterized protein n=1 Tax=Portunus trituberculatus TaxID=210409 RepID=A0A5B7II11_PORTR|nr:hypothetical protein [Portunus trituberculatus]